MRHLGRVLAALLMLVLIGAVCGCGGSGGPERSSPSLGGTAADSASAIAELTPGFDLLPPLGEAREAGGALNAQAHPVVSIYLGSEASKGALVTSFQSSAVAVVDDHFQVDWDTGAAEGGLPEGATDCVIEISWDGALLGFVDCQIDRTNGQGKKAADPDYFGLRDGRVLPIKFFIGSSVAVMDSGGGTVASADGAVTVSVPEGALAEPAAISVEPTSPEVASDRLAPGSTYQFGPDGIQFAEPVEITIRYDASALPEYMLPGAMRLLTLENGDWVGIVGSSTDGTQV